jgi:hypothetical protein
VSQWGEKGGKRKRGIGVVSVSEGKSEKEKPGKQEMRIWNWTRANPPLYNELLQ